MKKVLVLALFVLLSSAAHAEYRQINMTVFGMDCAPCAHAIHVSMMGIKGVDTVKVDLNTGLVNISLSPETLPGCTSLKKRLKRMASPIKMQPCSSEATCPAAQMLQSLKSPGPGTSMPSRLPVNRQQISPH